MRELNPHLTKEFGSSKEAEAKPAFFLFQPSKGSSLYETQTKHPPGGIPAGFRSGVKASGSEPNSQASNQTASWHIPGRSNAR